MLDNLRHLHFIGIGGSGISALAYLAKAHGLKVTGSDVAKNPTTERLEQDGIVVFIGHQKENVNELTELVVYSEAIDKKTNPEYVEAKNRGLQTMSYFELLGELSAKKKTIVITGTHGKTTTTAMLGQALIEAGLDPTVIVGTRVPYFENRNIHIGHSKWLVVEGCEYRRNFSSLNPFGMMVLNCEWEHVDYFKSEEDYILAFQELAQKLPEEGVIIYNQTDKNAQKIAQHAPGKKIPVNFTDTSEIRLKVPGDFNLLNAAHALKAGEEMGADHTRLLMGLHHFHGTARRMEFKGELEGVLVMDDYAHHPTEIKATLSALKQKYPDKRLICVFQPHQYSRTFELLNAFKTAFGDADKIIIPNIYEARDTKADKAKISAEGLSQMIPNTLWGQGFEGTLEWLSNELKSGDLVVTMGAGDVYKIGEAWLELKEK